MKRICVFMLLCVPVAGFAADPFKEIVKAIEQKCGVRHTGIPWFARAMMKPVMWGYGFGGLKIAEFENCPSTGEGSQARLANAIERTVGPEWQQMVRVRSRYDNETVYIYVRPLGQKFAVLIVTVEPSEANVVQLNINPRQLERWIDDTGEMAKSQVRHRKNGRPRAGETEVLISSNTPGGYGILVP